MVLRGVINTISVFLYRHSKPRLWRPPERQSSLLCELNRKLCLNTLSLRRPRKVTLRLSFRRCEFSSFRFARTHTLSFSLSLVLSLDFDTYVCVKSLHEVVYHLLTEGRTSYRLSHPRTLSSSAPFSTPNSSSRTASARPNTRRQSASRKTCSKSSGPPS